MRSAARDRHVEISDIRGSSCVSDQFPNDRDHLRYTQILAAHEAALDAGTAGYIDPVNGYFVFTAGYLCERGHRCETGCRHCPYLDEADRR